jgi:CRP/FNR family transcriptional regulator, cyclic AMP receptor protein
MTSSKIAHAAKTKSHAPETTANSAAPGTLFAQLLAEPLRHLVGQYPVPARLNEHWLRCCASSNKARLFPRGTILFEEGSKPDGVTFVLDGLVKKSITSAQGRTLVLGFFGPGTVLGLAANVLGRAHAVTAETVEDTKALFVARNEVIREMQTNATVAWHVAQLVSESYYFLAGKIRSVDLSESAPQKIARCLLELVAETANSDGEHYRLRLSQETIAQMVGTSRETVSRQLSRLRKNGVVQWSRSDFVIQNLRALEHLADSPPAAA